MTDEGVLELWSSKACKKMCVPHCRLVSLSCNSSWRSIHCRVWHWNASFASCRLERTSARSILMVAILRCSTVLIVIKYEWIKQKMKRARSPRHFVFQANIENTIKTKRSFCPLRGHKLTHTEEWVEYSIHMPELWHMHGVIKLAHWTSATKNDAAHT